MTAPSHPAVADPRDAWVARFDALLPERRRREPTWLVERRREGIARVAEGGLPTTRDEGWRFTNPAPLVRTRFRPAAPAAVEASALREAFDLVPAPAARLVFVNGHFVEGLSVLPGRDARFGAARLAEALVRAPERLEGVLARPADRRPGPWAALNLALFDDGACLLLPRETQGEAPVHLVFVTVGAEEPGVSHPRAVLLLEPGSRATVVETHVDLGGGVSFSNGVTEAVLGAGARLEHVRALHGSAEGLHVGALRATLARDAGLASLSVAFGGRLSRVEIDVALAGEGASCALDGLYLATGTEHVDHQTRIEHAAPHGTSRELYKGILDGAARAVFAGSVHVREGAQRTDARQANHNLLLSDTATVDTKPELEIFADDVKCAHGATVGQIDEEQVFYLRSRGIGLAAARAMLVRAFAAEVLGRAGGALGPRLEAMLASRLPGGGAA
jgi:Fe-S cluster assembly protein SufD